MPRGGGRSAALFANPFATNQQVQSLFGNARTTAATALPQIGLGQQQIGTNLIGQGNQALNTATTGAQNQFQNQMAIQQRSDNIIGGLASGLMGLALAPVTGGGSLFGSLFKGGGGAPFGTYSTIGS